MFRGPVQKKRGLSPTLLRWQCECAAAGDHLGAVSGCLPEEDGNADASQADAQEDPDFGK